MIQYLHHQDIDKSKWDKCLDEAKYSILYGYSWYLDIISPQWDALIEGDYQTVFPLTWKRKYGVYYLTQPPYAQQLGVFSREMLNQEKIVSFLNSIPKKFLHCDLYMNPLNECALLSKYHHRIRKTYHVPLSQSYLQIFERYSGDTKRNLKKFSRRNLILKPITVQHVIDIYKKNVWYKTPVLKLKDYQTLEKLTAEVSERKNSLILGAFENGVLSAGTIFFICGDKIIFVFGSSNKTGRRNGAMRFIFDQVIQSNSNSNLILDFEGSSINSVEYFYKSFGSDKIIFTNIKYSKHPLLSNMINIKQKISKLIAKEKIKNYFLQREAIESEV
jgi:hypothetical protein